VSHQVAALKRIIDRFGAYMNRLITLSEDSTLKAVDRQKLKGYIKKWHESKIVLGCAFFHNLLNHVQYLVKFYRTMN
jgi:hypothetical protein